MSQKITTLQELYEAKEARRSVYTPNERFGPLVQRKPAAFVLNMSGTIILKLIKSGLYTYEPKSKREIK